MSSWTPLLPIAMVGTERQPGPLPEWSGEIGQLASQAALAVDGPSNQVLRAMAVIAASQAGGPRRPGRTLTVVVALGAE